MLLLLALLMSAPRDSISDGILPYREITAGCFDSATDTGEVLAQIEDLDLLARVVLDPGVEDEDSDAAYQDGLYRAGPNRFFCLLRSNWPKWEEPPSSPRYVEIRRLMGHRHVVVDGLAIRHEDMSAEEANAVLDRVESHLRQGASWKQTLEVFWNEFKYEINGGTTSKVGNIGNYVVLDDEALKRNHHYVREGGEIEYTGELLPRRMLRLSFIPATHVPPLLAATKGDVIRLDNTDLKAWHLYQVREVYEGVSTVASH